MLDLKEVEEALQVRLAELIERMEQVDDQLGNASDDDFEEMATEAADDETLESVGQASQNEANQIKDALMRIKNGSYGICTACDKAILPERLKAVPYASRCASCA